MLHNKNSGAVKFLVSHVTYLIHLWPKYISKKLIGHLNKLPEYSISKLPR